MATDRYDYELDFDHYRHMKAAQEGHVAMPVSGMVILRYLDTNGDECIAYTMEGEAMLPRTLGMIEWAKWDLCRNSFDPDEDDG